MSAGVRFASKSERHLVTDTKETKLTLFMGRETLAYKEKLMAIGEQLSAEGINVRDPRRGTISMAAVVRYLADEEAKRRKIEES
jgi:hypothetical protein